MATPAARTPATATSNIAGRMERLFGGGASAQQEGKGRDWGLLHSLNLATPSATTPEDPAAPLQLQQVPPELVQQVSGAPDSQSVERRTFARRAPTLKPWHSLPRAHAGDRQAVPLQR